MGLLVDAMFVLNTHTHKQTSAFQESFVLVANWDWIISHLIDKIHLFITKWKSQMNTHIYI